VTFSISLVAEYLHVRVVGLRKPVDERDSLPTLPWAVLVSWRD